MALLLFTSNSKCNPMKKKLLSIICFIIAFILIDICVRAFCTYSYNSFSQESSFYLENQFAISRSQADILIVGSSSGFHGYNPNILSDSLKCHVINSCVDAKAVHFQYITIDHFLKNGNIKTIIFDISKPQVEDYWHHDISPYKPFYWQMKSAKEYVDRVSSWHERVFMLSACYQYNGAFYPCFRRYLGNDEKGKDKWRPIPYTGKPFECELTVGEEDIVPDELCIEYLNRIVQLCKDNHIRLILCKSPGLSGSEKFNLFIDKYAHQNDVEFWNYNWEESIINDKTLFKDAVHLNEKGANMFTQIIVKRLQQSN